MTQKKTESEVKTIGPEWPTGHAREMPISELKPRERNPRTHSADQIRKIANSIQKFGWTQRVLIEPDGTIIAGHGRYLAALSLQIDSIPVQVAENWTQDMVRAYVIADNKLALEAGWDDDVLKEELAELAAARFDMELTAFSSEELRAFDPEEDADGERGEDDALPADRRAAISKYGDVWRCGRHLVLCGDARDRDAVSALMGGEKAECIWTDPPYNVAYEAGAGSVTNDDLPDKEFAELLAKAFRCAFENLAAGGAIYVAHADTEGEAFRREFRIAGFHLASCLIWRKQSMVLGHSDYQWQHEPILYGWRPGAAHRWYGDRDKTSIQQDVNSRIRADDAGTWIVQLDDRAAVITGSDIKVEWKIGSVLTENKPSKSTQHPTMKPVALIERMLMNSTLRGNVVLDLFGGSGSTLIACQKLRLRARIVELEPLNVDVIVARYEQFSRQPAIRVRDGAIFGELRGGVDGENGSNQSPASRDGG